MDSNNSNENQNVCMEAPRNKSFLDYFLRFDNKDRTKTVLVTVFLITMFYVIFWSAPKNFPVNSIYYLKSGQTLSVVSKNFNKSNIIRSQFWFKSFVYLFSLGHATVIEGNYSLYKKQNVVSLAWRVSHGNLDIVPVRIVIFEGTNSFEIADILAKKFPSFDKKVFLNLVEKNKLEGYLFPDTYFILPSMTEEQIIKLMNSNFYERINEVSADIIKFGKSQSDVIKMASIVEEEARTTESREIVAGILWKRISIKMALQVDSSFKYINGKTTATLSTEDLKIDSPYNSYTNRGLPPTPISNPGLNAIKATVHPIKTPYLYFLTDDDGNMHYAATFEEHVANKMKYLK